MNTVVAILRRLLLSGRDEDFALQGKRRDLQSLRFRDKADISDKSWISVLCRRYIAGIFFRLGAIYSDVKLSVFTVVLPF